MGIRSFFKKLNPLPSRQQFQRPPGDPVVPTGTFPIYPSVNQLVFISAYNDNSSVYTIGSLMARKFATLPRYLCEIENQGSQTQYKHILKTNAGIKHKRLMDIRNKAYRNEMTPVVKNPLMDLLNRPNPYMGQDSFYQLLYTYKKITGNAFVWLNRNDDTTTGDARLKLPVYDMWVVPSQYMTIQVNRDILFGEITGYTLYDRGSPVYFAKEDIIHWKDPNPRYDGFNFTHYYGISPLEPGMQLITQDKAGRDAMVAMYQNGGARGVLYNKNYEPESPEQASARKSAIDTKINNRNQKSAVVSMAGDWGYLQLGDSAVDMEFVDTMDKVFQRICNLLGCNPQLFETKTTFNNVEQARKDLITNAILPDACSYRDEENRMLLQAFGLDKTKYCIDIDISNVMELQDNMETLSKIVLGMWILTPNEMRAELGFDKSEEEGMDEIFIPNTLILIEDAAVPTSSLNDDPGTDPGADPNDDPNIGTNVSNNRGKRLLANEVTKAWDAVYDGRKNEKILP